MDDDGARRDRDEARPARPGGNTAGSGQRGEADRLSEAGPWPARLGGLEIAEKLLAARDLVGCKRFAERAVEADPLLPGADELLALRMAGAGSPAPAVEDVAGAGASSCRSSGS